MNVYESIMQGLNEAVEYEKGGNTARKSSCTIAEVPDISPEEIKSLRHSMNMSQNTFAAAVGVSKKTVEAWEAGINSPIGVARRLLSMLQTDNTIFEKCRVIGE